jgi:nitrite reductase (NADH) small subunit
MTAVVAVTRWETVCQVDRLLPERGVAALLAPRSASGARSDDINDTNAVNDINVQVALFRTHDGTVHAIGNLDPFSGAAVLSRGIVGDRGGVPTVASPVYKQAFSLLTGRCLDDPDVAVPVYPVRVSDGWLQVGLP